MKQIIAHPLVKVQLRCATDCNLSYIFGTLNCIYTTVVVFWLSTSCVTVHPG